MHSDSLEGTRGINGATRRSQELARKQIDQRHSESRREKGQILASRGSSQAYHVGCNVWVPETGPDTGPARQKVVRWVKGQVTGSVADPTGAFVVSVRTEEGHERKLRASELPLQNERDDTVDDLVKSDFLHEPG